MKQDEYLNILKEQIRCKMARETVEAEIRCHIEDQTEDFLEEGMSLEEAEDTAVAQMGDPVETGGALNRIHRPQMAWGTIALVGILGAVGILIQYVLRKESSGDQLSAVNFGRQTLYLLFSFCLMILVCFVDYSRIGAYAKTITAGMFILIMAVMAVLGVPVNGVTYWLSTDWGVPFFVSVQMAALLFVPLYGAVLYTYRGKGYVSLLMSFLWMLPGLLTALIIPSVLTAVTLLISYFIVLSAALWKGWFKVAGKAVLAVLWSAAVLLPVWGCLKIMNHTKGYQAERLKTMLNSEYAGSFRLRAVRRMIESSNWIGRSTGRAQVGDLSNYTLTYTIYYYGILAGILLAGLILFLFLRFFRVSFRQRNQLGMIMGVGCAAVLTVQLLIYLADNLGIINMPSYCPFLNYGGSGMAVSFLLYGLMLSICRYEKVMSETWVRKHRLPGKILFENKGY